MSNVQIWNGSTWMDFYTLPNATSSTLGGVKIGNNITVNSGTISLTKSNVTSALGYTPLSLSGGTMTGAITLPENTMGIKLRTHDSYETGFIYGTAGNEAITLAMKNPVTTFQIVYGTTPSAFTSNTWQAVTPLFQTKDSKVIINRKITQTSDTTNLKLLDVNGDMAATTIYEGGTALSSKYAAVSHNHDNIYLGKTTYEWNKEFAAGSNGAVSLGRYNIYDTQLTFDITTTTAITLSGKLVIAAQNGDIRKATVYGDASNTLVNYLTIYQSAITNSKSWIEIFCNFPAWSKNKVHIYGVSLNSATVTRQMASVTFTNGVPSGVTSGDTKWTGTIINDITTYCSAKNHNHDSAYLGKTATAANSNKLNNQEASYYAKDSEVVKTSGNQDVGGDKTFNGQTTIDNLTLTTISGAPTINVYNTKNVSGYLIGLPYNNGLDCTIATTDDLPTAGTGLNLSNGVFSVKTGYATNGKNYKVAADNSGNLYVNVPWTDTNTDTHYINYLQIKGNDTEAVKFTQKENTSLNLKPGSNVSISATSGEITISATDTKYNTATQSAAGLMSSTDKTKLDGIATGATKVTTDTVSGWGYTKNTGTVTQVKVGTTAYSPSSGVVSLPAYPSIPTSLKNPNSVTIKVGTDTVSSYDGSAAKTFTLAASTTAGAFTVSDGTTTKTVQLAGKFTDNNSWRPVVDNLTSTATDQSLSANQGKVLKGLVDGKAASDHKHSQYLTSHLYRPIKIKDTTTVIGNTSSTALNLKEGTNISLSHDGNGGITISSTASGGGMTSTKIFEGAGDSSGYYTTTLTSGNYKILLFEVNVSDFDFYLSVPTDYIKTGSKTLYLAAGNAYNGALGIVEITASNTNFSASVNSGNIIVYNANVYAYK